MIFNGRQFAREVEEQVALKVRGAQITPRVVSFLVGDDPASQLYTQLKAKAAERVGILYEVRRLPATYQPRELVRALAEAGSDDEVNGIMLQLPLPGQSEEVTDRVLQAIPLEKDVDGLRWQESGVMPATARAVISILESTEADSRYGITDLWRRNFVVVGATGSVGRPLVHWLRQRTADVGEIRSTTPNAVEIISKAEVLISAVGKPLLIKASQVKEGVVAVDVGISMVEGKAQGDMEQGVYEKASVAVPVPGGVGPVTVASLMANAVDLCLWK